MTTTTRDTITLYLTEVRASKAAAIEYDDPRNKGVDPQGTQRHHA